ncbi:MAG: glycosyltransferase family 4 protein [Woronichinia naegeliana WA131]|uniref:Glycosyltransferase family 4 protein n=1 Tax=Woronichinia naegeliana WA131 TaxID=2824559 RepID=A0A977L1P6_9CYAN|nr:MAG: glycosyltransferase family 4 protein [Woronichinia naegeliana WA131]
MRVLLYSYNYYPEPIGIAPLMTELAEGLVKRGHEVRVVTAMPWYPASEIAPEYRNRLFATEERNGVLIQRCYVWAKKERTFRNRALFELSFAGLSFFQALRGWRPDAIFLTIPGLPVCVPAILLSRLYGAPMILNVQDILPDAAVHVGLIRNPKMIRLFEKLESLAYRHAHKIAVIADGFVDNLLKKGVKSAKIREIPNWVDTHFIKPLFQPSNYFRRENSLEDKFVVLYSGNIGLTQPLETLIEAAGLLQSQTDIQFVIVGEEEATERLSRYCQRRRIHNVLFRPFQPRQQLPEMLAAADIVTVLQKENVISFNMPSKIQVLLSSQRPIVASVPADGTAAKAVNGSGGGVVVPPEDPQALANAILALYYSPAQMAQLAQAGRRYAENYYRFDLALDRYEELLTEAIAKPAQAVQKKLVLRN